ncbi:hypothetical protein JTE90_003930 [Oedothorax gibbosus]|uniref:Uncharacterized protein n=1 Tax=Oedothorax gibbosus TaxID=931172 RepID=A0AAV6UX17_9ARAC|nr:hypothetical protein JTE90_003930 [Oedothorax gibbosus]
MDRTRPNRPVIVKWSSWNRSRMPPVSDGKRAGEPHPNPITISNQVGKCCYACRVAVENGRFETMNDYPSYEVSKHSNAVCRSQQCLRKAI